MLVTSTFEEKPKYKGDLRFLVSAKKKYELSMEPYVQVFGDRHGFIPNLSILDLLFNLGPNSVDYLNKQFLPKTDD
jgi:hypothetical protein